MDDTIVKVLEELEERSILEKIRKVDVLPEERMLAITKETGELLNMILRIKNAQNVLEIGMSTGYSTIWFADAIKENKGQIFTIEKNPKKIKRAEENFKKAGVSEIIKINQGNAIEILEEYSKKQEFQKFFDFVFIDADKENVVKYFELAFPMIKNQGVIVTDNMLYPEKYREEMKKFSNYLKNHQKVNTITSPIGNGEEITIKISD
ncbi:O-methyltransferase [Nitrosopumilus sp. K4]|uniref:O-methyltransferase n=1 Tax=Nitrosopumilus sp. K4 TaxID=2795383 RepID=UPI002010D1FD|nr:O-methyltransferase [Nitrosopumilus sp. K4]